MPISEIVQEWPSQDWLLAKGPIREFHPSNILAPETEMSKAWKKLCNACEKQIRVSREKKPNTSSALITRKGVGREIIDFLDVKTELDPDVTLEIHEMPSTGSNSDLENLYIIIPWYTKGAFVKYEVKRWQMVTKKETKGDRVSYGTAVHNLDTSEIKTLAGII